LTSTLTALKRLTLGAFLVAMAITSEALGSSPGSRRALMADPSAAIAFVHQGEVDTVDVVDSRGARVRELMQDAGAVTVVVAEGHRSGLDWSSDGRRMLVRSNRGLRALERDGSFSAVPFGRSCDIGNPVSWSPDGKRVACQAGDGINIISPSGVLSLFRDAGVGDSSKYEPSWSPDGRSLAYVEGIDGGEIRIYDFARKVSRRIPSTSGRALVHAPTWSPDSKLLAFSNHCFSGCKPTIWVVHPDGRGLKRVIVDGLRPAWSPDGREMVFDSGRDGDFEIFVVTLATGKVRQLTRNHVDDLSAVWR
jgi:WD40-like Beta Propeller Repeat